MPLIEKVVLSDLNQTNPFNYFNQRNRIDQRQSAVQAVGKGVRMMGKQYKHSELTGRIIGCAMQVHRILGNGFQEVIYQRALGIEFRKQGLTFLREREMDIYYDNTRVGTRRVDFFVEDAVMLEIKAQTDLTDVHMAQAINYLEAYGLEVGLLINFGARSLQFKRVVNSGATTKGLTLI